MNEIDVCESCSTNPAITLAADPNNGHPDGYGSVDPCDRCGDGRAGVRYRAVAPTSDVLLRLPFDRDDVRCPTCRTLIASGDVNGREATAFCRFCDRVYPCFHDELHRIDLGGEHQIGPVCVSVTQTSLIYSANCLCQDMVSSRTVDGAREWRDQHIAEVAADTPAA